MAETKSVGTRIGEAAVFPFVLVLRIIGFPLRALASVYGARE